MKANFYLQTSFILLFIYLLITIDGLSIDIIEKDFKSPIEKISLINNSLFVGTVNKLDRLSSLTLVKDHLTLKFDSKFNSSISCHSCYQYHWKVLLPIKNNQLLICGTIDQGLCQIIDENFHFIANSSSPIVANDQINSTLVLYVPENNFVYMAVTNTNDGNLRWQIPNISGRSLNKTNFMNILSINRTEGLSVYDSALRFMSRQHQNFIVQYISTFYTNHYIYFLTNQPVDIGQDIMITKVVRFCRNDVFSIIRSYSEIPLVCSNRNWIMKSAQTILDQNDQMILIGLFVQRDGSTGTNICSWNIEKDIDQAFKDNYKKCYSMGIGQRGLNFIKPNENCRKDENWSIHDDLCSSIISDRLPYPVGGINPINGHLFYENSSENSSALHLSSFGSLVLFSQGLTNGTFKLGILDSKLNVSWIYSHQLSTKLPVLSDILFDNDTASFYFASYSKIYRLSLSSECKSRLTCDECLSSSRSIFCGWCSTTERCTLSTDCPSNFWQRNENQCTRLINIQPLNSQHGHDRLINLTFSKLPRLQYNESYRCVFTSNEDVVNLQAIQVDTNQLSCPTPSNYSQTRNTDIERGTISNIRLSIKKLLSDKSFITISEFPLYNCSSHSTCESCQQEIYCRWCSNHCSSKCTEDNLSKQCSTFNYIESLNKYIEYGQTIDIALKLSNRTNKKLDCRLNETIFGFIDENDICRLKNLPKIDMKDEQSIYLSIYDNNISIIHPIKLTIYQCNMYQSDQRCQSHSTCIWCNGKCLSKQNEQQCSTNSFSKSVTIQRFHPEILPLNGRTIVRIYLNELINIKIDQITLADIPCSITNISKYVECRSNQSKSNRQGQIKIFLRNSMVISSKEVIEYRQSSIVSFNSLHFYELNGQMFEINGQNLKIGSTQQIFIGQYQCFIVEDDSIHNLKCYLPLLSPNLYNVTVVIDEKTILTSKIPLKITPKPIIEDIYPLTSFASGGRLITIRGMYFQSAKFIYIEFSYRKWIDKLEINSNDINISNVENQSLFTFRTPSISYQSNDFPALPVNVDVSIYFDNLISFRNISSIHYLPDILLNISSNPPVLSYTGEELNIQIENLTEAASFDDIQLFVGCNQCQLKRFTPKGLTCQPPKSLLTQKSILINNKKQQVNCTGYNSSIGPIYFRIGYREYLIGYLSYIRSSTLSSSKYSIRTIICLILSSSLLTIVLLLMALFLYTRVRKSRDKRSSSLMMRTNNKREQQLWSTTTSLTATGVAPYYEIYEHIPSISSTTSSNKRSVTCTSYLVCPYHNLSNFSQLKQQYSGLSAIQKIKVDPTLLKCISIEHENLKKLIFTSDMQCVTSNRRQSMELFYDLLNMSPFSEAFYNKLIEEKSIDLYRSYSYVFRYNVPNIKVFSHKREISLIKLILTFFLQSKTNLIELFQIFDNLIDSIVNLIDSGPCDQILNLAVKSISSSTLLTLNIDYNYLNLPINYENLLHFHLNLLDCDTIEQMKQKVLYYLYSYDILYDRQVDIHLPLKQISSRKDQVPTLKEYLLNPIISCQKTLINNSTLNRYDDQTIFQYHLCRKCEVTGCDHQINQQLENKNEIGNILLKFYEKIANGLECFSSWEKETIFQNQTDLFQQYIQVISDVIRRVNLLMKCRSTCPIIKSCLNTIADGLEFVFQTKTEFSTEIEQLFEEERHIFSSFNSNLFKIPPNSSKMTSFPSMFDIRSVILDDDAAIDCLFQLYQFYELHSESINQYIGDNHVTVLLPVHHLLVQIRHLINSDTIRTNTAII